jgi:hypothetical protein
VINESKNDQRERLYEAMVAMLGMAAVFLAMLWMLLSNRWILITLGVMAFVSVVWIAWARHAGRTRF